MTLEEAEAAGYGAFAAGDPGVMAQVVAQAHESNLDLVQIAGRIETMDAAAPRCVISRAHAAFWRKVQAKRLPD